MMEGKIRMEFQVEPQCGMCSMDYKKTFRMMRIQAIFCTSNAFESFFDDNENN